MADVLLQNGDLPKTPELTTSIDLIPQRVKVRLLLSEGEWLLDETAGQPWIEWLTDARISAQDVAPVIRAVIQETRGVDEITSFSVDDAGDTWTFEASIRAGRTDTEGLELTFELKPDQTTPLFFEMTEAACQD